MAVPGGSRTENKELEKTTKYQDWKTEMKKLWYKLAPWSQYCHTRCYTKKSWAVLRKSGHWKNLHLSTAKSHTVGSALLVFSWFYTAWVNWKRWLQKAPPTHSEIITSCWCVMHILMICARVEVPANAHICEQVAKVTHIYYTITHIYFANILGPPRFLERMWCVWRPTPGKKLAVVSSHCSEHMIIALQYLKIVE